MKTKFKALPVKVLFNFLLIHTFSLTLIAQPCNVEISLPPITQVCGPCPWTLYPYVTGGTAPYTYIWSTGETTPTIQTCIAGATYTLTVYDAMGCYDTASTFILQDTLSFTTTHTNVSCLNSCDGTITINITSGVPPYLASYCHPQAVISYSNIFTLTGVCGGNCFITVQSGAGFQCIKSDSVVVASSSCYCDSTSCERVCERSITNFSAPLHAGSTYQWFANGAISFTSNLNTVEVLWNDNSVNNGNGLIQYIETYVNGTQDTVSVCYYIADSPVADFSTAPAASGGVVNICSGNSVSFINNTTGAVSYQWDLGNGNNSTLPNPVFAFVNTGDFMVHLTASTQCGCTSEDSVLVHVEHAPGPDVTCASVVCAGDTAVYNTSTVCATYNWSVTGGTIISPLPYTSSILVVWGNGSSANGTVTLDVGTCTGTCATPTTVSIPIIPVLATISGEDVVCLNETKTYSVPNIPGGIYNWTLSNGNGSIISGNGTSTITVFWASTAGTCTINVAYSHVLLDCSGSGSLVVNIRPELSAYSISDVCSQLDSVLIYGFASQYNGNFTFVITDPLGNSTSNVSTSPFIFYWTTEGAYTVAVTALPFSTTASCNDTAYTSFEVYSVVEPDSISGKNIICPGNTEEYEAFGQGVPYEYYWTVQGGTLNTNNGNPVTVTWDASGPYVLRVRRRINAGLPTECESDRISITVSAATIPGIAGSLNVCANGYSSYSISGTPLNNVYYEWQVTPSLGSIVGGQGTPSANIEWLNATGTATVTVTALNCNNVSYQLGNILVQMAAAPVISPPNPSFCEGSSVTLSSSAASVYQWRDSTNALISSNQNVTIFYGGHFSLTVYDNNNCKSQSTVFVNEKPAPTASISTPDATLFCIPDPVNTNLYALTNTGYSYQWYLNGTNAPGATNSPIYNATQVGMYNVLVTNADGCTALSDFIETEQVVCNGGGICTSNEWLDFTFSDCNPIQFGGSVSTANVTNPQWQFGDPLSGNNNAAGLNATHDFSKAGYYHVSFLGTVANLTPPPPFCTIVKTYVAVVKADNDFTITTACANSPSVFTDLSTYLPGYPITSYEWDFGDLSPVSNQQHATHSYTNSGVYTVTHTIVSGTCTIVKTQQITINGITPGFNFSPTTSCTGTPVSFNDVSVSNFPSLDWLWDFDDGTTSANQHPEKTFNTSGNKNITITVTDISGCVALASQNITINAMPAPGVITPPGPINTCGNIAVTLTAPAGINYLWSNYETTSAINVNAAGDYSVVVTTSNNCVYLTPPVKINYSAPPHAIITSGKTDLCAGTNIYLTAYYNFGYSYQWFETGNPVPISANPFMNIANAIVGVYNYYLVMTKTSTGCKDTSDIFPVTVHALPAQPVINVSAAGTLCAGNDFTITLTNPVNGYSYTWQDGNTVYYNGGSLPSIITSFAGNYNVTAIDSFGCSALSNTIVINAEPDLSAVLTGCYEFCDSATVIIPAPPGYAAYQWLQLINNTWVTVSTSPNLQSPLEGAYLLLLTSFNGCIDTSDVLVLNQFHCCASVPATIQGSILNCYGDTNGIASVSVQAPGNYFYYWSTGNTTSSVSGLPTGTYYVTVYNGPWCKSMFTIIIKSPSPMPVPLIYFNGDTLFSSITDQVYMYQWFQNLIAVTGANGIYYITTDTSCFNVMITDVNGCTAMSDSVCITPTSIMEFASNNQVFVFPNPVTNMLHVINNDEAENTFTLWDITGRLVLQHQFLHHAEIDLSQLSSGVFFYEVKGRTKVFTVGKLLKE